MHLPLSLSLFVCHCLSLSFLPLASFLSPSLSVSLSPYLSHPFSHSPLHTQQSDCLKRGRRPRNIFQRAAAVLPRALIRSQNTAGHAERRGPDQRLTSAIEGRQIYDTRRPSLSSTPTASPALATEDFVVGFVVLCRCSFGILFVLLGFISPV